jgi:hypothetical protein
MVGYFLVWQLEFDRIAASMMSAWSARMLWNLRAGGMISLILVLSASAGTVEQPATLSWGQSTGEIARSVF